MTGGELTPAAPRKRGRPKGSGNRRAKDLKGFIDARYGGSAAQQMAQACMVTPAEVRAAGGSVLMARVEKARELAKAIGCKVPEAFEMLSKELAALAPYVDQRQPLAIEQSGDAWRPSVVVMQAGQAGQAFAPTDVEFVEVFEGEVGEVSQSKSHDEAQPVDLPLLSGAAPAD